ncbi:subtilisin-like protease SBT1.6 [Magnolia sinica]|uniref:subtilisin-like protease SBT1.6 n=1 Tax=Magnolia sinica TaxID=86752 RepID=UPI00265B6605|nr:subtilisin-like protease SBT1.6 [Magnolia sinica]
MTVQERNKSQISKQRRMPSLLSFPAFTSLSLSLLLTISISLQIPPSKKTFIVLVDSDSKPSPFISHHHWYSSLISPPPPPFIHIYTTLFHGFSANLASHQSDHIKKSPGVLAIFPDSILNLHTTRSPGFLGLNNPNSSISRLSNGGDDTIIGILDTGIWPERKSFTDYGMGPMPPRWRGECMEGNRFNRSSCNRKLIGARFFAGGYNASPVGPVNDTAEFRSPRDSNGHGTHVASIAAGAHVAGASFRSFARGTAKGMAPKARIAIYKVCWDSGCLLSDVCKAMEEAISDGVDIISISLGLSSPLPFYLDLFAIASFRAFQKGIFISVSAGNEGPYQASMANSPPWIMTVGAGTIDRDFPATISLGNGNTIHGVSLTPHDELTRLPHPLVKISPPFSTFSPQSMHGRIVLCMAVGHVPRIPIGAAMKRAGAVAMIISHGNLDPRGVITESHVIPAIVVGVTEAKFIDDYISYGKDPTAVIVSDGLVSPHIEPAPMVVSFSSRGPNMVLPEILKPDLLAPGVNILGAWTDVIAPPDAALGIQRLEFNILSGTSMACPHVSGVAALIRSAHHEWSPSEIKSALMTTASQHCSTAPFPPIIDESSGNAASPFDIGAGHLHPVRAVDPGLVYDVGPNDLVNFLCGLNYTDEQMKIVTGKRLSCVKDGVDREMNYPAFVVVMEEIGVAGGVFERRLKKVSEDEGVVYYRAKVVGLEGFRVWVKPRRLRFCGGPGESLGFRLGVGLGEKGMDGGDGIGRSGLAYGALIWREGGGKHVVRSPIVVFSKKRFMGFKKV